MSIIKSFKILNPKCNNLKAFRLIFAFLWILRLHSFKSFDRIIEMIHGFIIQS